MVQDSSPHTVYLSDYQPPAYLIEFADLNIELHEQGTRVISCLTMHRNPLVEPQERLRLDGEGLNPIWIRLNGEELPADRYLVDDESLTLFQPPEELVLETEVEIAPELNTALEGLYRSTGMFCTQCEAQGFRKITWFLDRPDVMTRFTTRLSADKAAFPVLLSNGNPLEQGNLPAGRHYAVWDDPIPKPCYLFALVAGNLQYIQDSHTTPSGRTIDLRIYVEPENIDKCDHAMRSLINAMRWDEQEYGREYDLDVYNIVAVNDFNMGAMENKGLNIFNSKYVLARPDTATDGDFQGIEGVIAHEYFHNWTGNRITCRDWFQLSLKEGFTVFRDQEFSADMGSRGVKRIEDVRMLRAHQFAEDASPMAHPVRPASYIEINNFYTLTVYEKGAEVVRMQARLLGPEVFRKATDLYFERHDGQAVTTDEFVACMADASGRDLQQFKRWYDYAGTPCLDIDSEYDQQAGTYTLIVEQRIPDTPGQTDKPPLHIPFEVGLLGADGTDMAVSRDNDSAVSATHMVNLRQPRETLVFHGVRERPVPSLLRGFSAPVKLEYDYSEHDLMFLMAHDSDGFNRWDAAQTLLRKTLLAQVADPQQGAETLVDDALIEAVRSALLDDAAEPALTAEILTLPSIGYLGDFMGTVDIDGLYRVREGLKANISRLLREDLLTCYEQLSEAADYAITPQAIGRRSLKNRVLSYLMAAPDDEVSQLCLNQYGAQHNMTDVVGALGLLADSDHAAREEVLADFADRWQQDALVMDKWFAVQAMSSREDTLAQVQRLMSHPGFSMRNPNKVRSLIGAFSNANPLRFHAADASGYAFLTDQVLTLDALNPQIAARLLRVMSRWQRYDGQRQQAMRDALQRIANSNVSKDVYEVASRSLQE